MPISESRLAYPDCAELFQKADEDPKGCRIYMGTREAARFLVMRMHKCRQINRRDNAEIYPSGDPMHGASPWDKIKCSIKEDENDEWWVYAEKVELDASLVESLSELGE